MFTLKLVFVGLFALAPISDEEALILAARAMDHHARIEQRVGTCTGDCQIVSASPAASAALPATDQLQWFPEGIEIQLELDESVPLELARTSRTEVDGEELSFPRNVEESYSLSWIPSVAAMVAGGAPLRPSCRNLAENCDIVYRLRLDGGRVGTCHLAHVPANCEPANKLLMFDVGPRVQALGNALSLEVTINAGFVALTGSDYSGRVVQRAILTPNAEDKLTLMVFNEPPFDTTHGCQLPSEVGHFRRFYQLLHPITGAAGRMSQNRPRRVNQFADGVPGSCEVELDRYNREKRHISTDSFPHSPTECSESSIP